MMELTGLKTWSFTIFEYGEKWRTYRRLFHEFFNPATAKKYDEDQRRAVSRLLKNLSEHPVDFHNHIQLATGSIALSITYDIRVDSSENPYFRMAEEVIEFLQVALVPGVFPVEFLPFREPSLLQQLLRRNAKPIPLNSSSCPIMAPWRRFPRLWGTCLQAFDGHNNTTDATCYGTTQGTLSSCM